MATEIKEPVTSRKRPTNISLPGDMVESAKALGINVSKACETGLAAEIKRARDRRWKDEHREAIEKCNTWIEANGLPLANFRIL